MAQFLHIDRELSHSLAGKVTWQQQDSFMKISTITSVQTTVYGTIQNKLLKKKICASKILRIMLWITNLSNTDPQSGDDFTHPEPVSRFLHLRST